MPCGMSHAYSVMEMARILAESDDSEEYRRIYRQIRYWTEKDTLPPDSDENPGTGVSLEYDENGLYHAAILQELSSIGVAQSALMVLANQLTDVYGTRIWARAKSGKAVVYLTGLFGPSGNVDWRVTPNAPATAEIDTCLKNPELQKRGNPYLFTSAVVINLTNTFKHVKIT
jgi:hypothetical protein